MIVIHTFAVIWHLVTWWQKRMRLFFFFFVQGNLSQKLHNKSSFSSKAICNVYSSFIFCTFIIQWQCTDLCCTHYGQTTGQFDQTTEQVNFPPPSVIHYVFSQAAVQVPEDCASPLNPNQRGNREIHFPFHDMSVVGGNKSLSFFSFFLFPFLCWLQQFPGRAATEGPWRRQRLKRTSQPNARRLCSLSWQW